MRKHEKRLSPTARWLLAPTILSLALVLGTCSKPRSSEATDLLSRGGLETTATHSPQATEDPSSIHEPEEPSIPEASPTGSPAVDSGSVRRSPDQGSVDSEELVGLGEFGLLPTLLQALSPGIDCDLDDPLSACQ